MACKIGLVVYAILQTIACLLIAAGTPLDQFRLADTDNVVCFTFWGFKPECYKSADTTKTADLWVICDRRKDIFTAAEAMSMISIVACLAAAVLGFVQLCCCRCLRWASLALTICGALFAVLCTALMLVEYTSDAKPLVPISSVHLLCLRLKAYTDLGVGFGLIIAGWCLCLISIVFLMLPC